MKIFCFTATGNSLFVSKLFEGEVILINDNLNKKQTYIDDIIGFIFPCFAYNMPKIVEQFIKNNNFKAEYMFAIFTYGSDIKGAHSILYTIGKMNNVNFNYINSIRMIQNYVPEFDVSFEKKMFKYSKFQSDFRKIKLDIDNRKKFIRKDSNKNKIYSLLFYIQIKLGFVLNKKEGQSFLVNSKCNKCKLCIIACPKKNIYLDESLHITFRDKCEVCLCCIHICPNNALHLKNELSDSRYFNEYVSITELIKGNSSSL